MSLFSCKRHHSLEEVKLIDYPSASAIEYLDNSFYVMGDDANSLLILDENLNPVDSLPLYSFSENRIPKAVKADLEAMTLLNDKHILIVGSGSLSPNRDVGWLVDPFTKRKDSLRFRVFYSRLAATGLKQLNIEGLCAIPGAIILANRGNKSFPKNHLIVTDSKFWNFQNMAPIDMISVEPGTDSTMFTGISGLTYSKNMDWLIMTASTEDTRNNMDDGAIGKSYCWIIKDISSKKRWKAINPDIRIDLDELDKRFKGQKIESACIVKETTNSIHLVLAADNDNGSSSFFKLIIQKKN